MNTIAEPPRKKWFHRVILAIPLAIGVIALVRALYPIVSGMYDNSGSRSFRCEQNLSVLAEAMSMYSQDYDGIYPLTGNWVSGLAPYIASPGSRNGTATLHSSVFHCPSDTSGARCSYGMNRNAGGKPTQDLYSDVEPFVLLYETSRPGNNPVGGPEDVVRESRHRMSTRDGPGLFGEDPSGRKPGKFYVFAGQYRPVYLLDEKKVEGYLAKGFLPGSAVSSFEW